MRLLRVIAFVLGALVLVAGSVSAGCGGNEFVLADAAVDESNQETSAEPDAMTQPDSPEGAFCDALRSYYQRCQYAAQCDQRNLDNCAVYGAALSEVARAAFEACQSSIACARGGAAWVHETCVRNRLTAATPTTVQVKLADDYCATCGQASTACTLTAFYNEGIIQATDGPGFDSLLYNDTLVRTVDQTCVNALSCVGFRICEDSSLTSQVPADACRD
jgi:hypothetical protein